MKNKSKLLLVIFISGIIYSGFAQDNDFANTSQILLSKTGTSKLFIGGYAQVDYNQPFGGVTRQNGTLDVHRLVILFAYNFNDRTQFITEIEFEHVNEVFVEQAFLKYRITEFMNFKAGLLLIPMGIINEYHEPPGFNGVERPGLDNKIVPSTWREIGFGVSGNISGPSLKYQMYLVNGFNGYDGNANVSGAKGFRDARQKAAKSYIHSPNLSAKVNYYGIRGLNAGLSGYFGKTQSLLYDGLDMNNDILVETADSSVIGLSMFGFDYRFKKRGFQSRGQIIYSSHRNAGKYNDFTGSDVGDAMFGYYVDVSYNVLQNVQSSTKELNPFIRYEHYDTHFSTPHSLSRNDAYSVNSITAGLGLKLDKGAVLKMDIEFYKSRGQNDFSKQLNAGLGVWF